MIILDTSALIRFFTRDDEAKAEKSKRLLESRDELLLIDAVAVELVFVLTKLYQQEKTRVIEVLRYLLARPNIVISDQMRHAAGMYETKNLSITDCLVISFGQGNKISSFDEKLLSVSGVKSVWGK